MLRFQKFSSYILLIFNVLLLFFLIFEEKIQLPLWLSPAGRMHPLLIHLPIGFAVLLIFFIFFKKEFDKKSYESIVKLLLTFTAITAAIVAVMGFLLSKEGNFDADQLMVHKWTGALVSFVSYLGFVFYDKIQFSNKNYGAIALLFIIAIAGHFGAEITHGENYLFEAFQSKKIEKVFDENSSMYEAAVYPILEAKCVNCHNDNKTKGQLNMSSIAKIVKGGKNGAIWKSGDALNSHIIQRANLPKDDKKHMPPAAKPQLTDAELALITAWINEGADTKRLVKNYLVSSKTKSLASNILNVLQTAKPEKIYSFSYASQSNLDAVNTPFCNVFQLSSNSPALVCDFFVSKKFEKKNLENISKISEQLVSLNLSKMPVTDEDLSGISKFKNLEKLSLNQTEITDQVFDYLKNCKNLISVSLAGTKITKEGLQKLMNLPNLKEVYVWNTGIDIPTAALLSKKYPKLNINIGSVNNDNEMLKLNPPILVNENFVISTPTELVLKHPFKNAKIRYTLNGEKPDSLTSNIFTKPFLISQFTNLKALATLDKWYASQILEYTFYKATYKPDSVYLITKPAPQYIGYGSQILIDRKLGSTENPGDKMWLGYRETDFIGMFEFKTPKKLNEVTLSYLLKTDSYIMPPTTIEIWAGNDKNKLKIIDKIVPPQSMRYENNKLLSQNFSLKNQSYLFVKLIAKPLKKLPEWHGGKGQPAWFFIDEVFFN